MRDRGDRGEGWQGSEGSQAPSLCVSECESVRTPFVSVPASLYRLIQASAAFEAFVLTIIAQRSSFQFISNNNEGSHVLPPYLNAVSREGEGMDAVKVAVPLPRYSWS